MKNFDSPDDTASTKYPKQTVPVQLSKNSTENIDRVYALIESEVFLNLSILEVQLHSNTLVVLCDHSVPTSDVTLLLKKAWFGPIEVYCASQLMAGGTTV